MAEKKSSKWFANYKNYRKVRNLCHFTSKCRGPAYIICNLIFDVPKENPVIFHSGSNYDNHFIIKGLANEFQREFKCFWRNTEKCKPLPIPLENINVINVIKL